MSHYSAISTLFCLNQSQQKKLEGYLLNQDQDETNRLAFLGDAILSLDVRQTLLAKYPGKKTGFLTQMGQIYVANKTLKLFLISLAPNEHRLQNMSDHSAGTVFEALLATCQEENRSSIIRSFMEKIDETLDPKKIVLEAETVTDSPDCNIIESELFFNKIKEATLLFQPKPRFNSLILKEKMSLAKFLHENIKTVDFPHDETSIVPMTWYSRKRMAYTENFYSCCGANKDPNALAFTANCLRNTWEKSKQASIHPGNLYVPRRSKGGGGGRSPFGGSTDHIPTCAIAFWNCCSKESTEPGCKNLYEDETTMEAPLLKAKRKLQMLSSYDYEIW